MLGQLKMLGRLKPYLFHTKHAQGGILTTLICYTLKFFLCQTFPVKGFDINALHQVI